MIKKKWALIPVLFLTLFISACSDDKDGQSFTEDYNIKVKTLEAVNEDGEKVSTDDYKGKLWIANFIFTSCPDVCPVLTTNMGDLQRMLKEEGLDVQLVSFSVDPDVDTPERMKQYIEAWGGDLDNWDGLTGYSQEEIEEFALESFKVLAAKQNGTVVHQNYFHLVSPEGKFIKLYKGIDDAQFEHVRNGDYDSIEENETMKQIVEDVKAYLK